MKNRPLTIALLASLAVLVSACASTPRPTPPVEGAPIAQPWGSVPLMAADGEIDENFGDSYIQSLLAKRDEHRRAGGTARSRIVR